MNDRNHIPEPGEIEDPTLGALGWDIPPPDDDAEQDEPTLINGDDDEEEEN